MNANRSSELVHKSFRNTLAQTTYLLLELVPALNGSKFLMKVSLAFA